MICDEALGSSLDSRKFADEFIKRRQADLNGVTFKSSNDWTPVGKPVEKPKPAGDSNGFEVVGKKGKKAKK